MAATTGEYTKLPTYLSTRDAARLVGMAPSTLETYRVRGGGPPYRKFGGSVRYELGELIAWGEVRTSTTGE